MTEMSFLHSPMALGFDRYRRLLDRQPEHEAAVQPPFDIKQVDEHRLRITIAVAGFAVDDLEIRQDDACLVVRGERAPASDAAYLHQGIAARSIESAFVLAGGVEVTGAWLVGGLLHIDLDLPRGEPEARRIAIDSAPGETEPDGPANEESRKELEAAAVAAGVPARLARFAVRAERGPEIIGVSRAAERLGVSRTTVYDWLDKRMLLGWKSTKRGFLIPDEQILGPGKVVDGLPGVLAIIRRPELAWVFLSEEWPFADDVVRPIDKLKAGHIEEVLAAAPSFGTAVT